MPPKARNVVPIHASEPAPRPAPVHPFDRLYGTDTGGLIPRAELLTGHENDAHLTAYYAVAPSILNALLKLWLRRKPAFPIDRYTFLDIGAGKGRALMTAALHPFHQAVGVELNPVLAGIARSNLETFARHGTALTDSIIVEGDALAVPLPVTPTVAFLFHPFEAPVMRRFIKRLEEEAHDPLDVLYVNAEHKDLFEASPRFRTLFDGLVPMSAEDHLADLAEIEGQTEYGSTGDELCAIYRLRRDSPAV